jgi:PAS domain S-box-containing protein
MFWSCFHNARNGSQLPPIRAKSAKDRGSFCRFCVQMETTIKNAILECAGEGIYGLDRDGLTTFANAAALRMTGWPLDEVLGKLQHALIHHSKPDGTPYPRKACPVYAALRDGEVHHSEDDVFWRKDGTSFPVEYTSTPLQKDGVSIGAVVIFRDITERKNRERWDQNYREVLELSWSLPALRWPNPSPR